MTSCDLIGDIAVLKFPEGTKLRKKREEASRFLKEHKSIKTVLEKADRVKGRLRIAKTRFLAGENKRETIYTESGCRFKLNLDETYFSPRIAGERNRVAEEISSAKLKKFRILVMFAGVAPFSIVTARKLEEKGKKFEIYSVEINRNASRYAEENVKLNKLEDYIQVIQSDVKKLKISGKFDFVIMPRPQLRETFLEYAWGFCKKGTLIYYYDFGKDAEFIMKRVEKDAKRAGKKIRILEFRKSAEVAPYKYKWLVKFIVN
jgi:tRNA (guanine37-N1)-methyltransferase